MNTPPRTVKRRPVNAISPATPCVNGPIQSPDDAVTLDTPPRSKARRLNPKRASSPVQALRQLNLSAEISEVVYGWDCDNIGADHHQNKLTFSDIEQVALILAVTFRKHDSDFSNSTLCPLQYMDYSTASMLLERDVKCLGLDITRKSNISGRVQRNTILRALILFHMGQPATEYVTRSADERVQWLVGLNNLSCWIKQDWEKYTAVALISLIWSKASQLYPFIQADYLVSMVWNEYFLMVFGRVQCANLCSELYTLGVTGFSWHGLSYLRRLRRDRCCEEVAK